MYCFRFLPNKILYFWPHVCVYSPLYRLQKEVAHYRKEVEDNHAQYQAVKADPSKDEYDAKRYCDLWEESLRMFPDAERRLDAAVTDLANYIRQHFCFDSTTTAEDEKNENEWLPIAKEILQTFQTASGATKQRASEGGAGGEGETTNIDDLADGEAF